MTKVWSERMKSSTLELKIRMSGKGYESLVCLSNKEIAKGVERK